MKMKTAIKWLSCMLIPVIYWKRDLTMKQNMDEDSVQKAQAVKNVSRRCKNHQEDRNSPIHCACGVQHINMNQLDSLLKAYPEGRLVIKINK